MTRRPSHVRRRALAPVAVLVVLSVLPACSSAADPPRASGAPVSASGADASRTPVAELQAATAHLLVERVHLTAAARAAAPAERADAVAALDEVTAALAGLLGSMAPAGRDRLLEALREVDRLAVAHADAGRSGEPVAVATALAGLAAAQDALVDAVAAVAPGTSSSQLEERLGDDLAAQLAVAGPDPYARLAEAAARAPGTARVLADGVGQGGRLGPTGARASALRVDLTAALTDHVLLAVAVAREAARPDGAANSAVRALEADGERLGELLGAAYPRLREPFLRSWGQHVDTVVRLARTRGALERREVLAYPPRLGLLLGAHVRGLPAATAAVELEPLTTALVDAVVAGAEGSPDASAALLRATATAPAVAALLAAAIAEDRRYA